MNNNNHYAALNHLADALCKVQRVPPTATTTAERLTLQEQVRCTRPIELKNDDRERANFASTASIGMVWIFPLDEPEYSYQESDRIIYNAGADNERDMRIRKVKPWPMTDPIYYELHVEDEAT